MLNLSWVYQSSKQLINFELSLKKQAKRKSLRIFLFKRQLVEYQFDSNITIPSHQQWRIPQYNRLQNGLKNRNLSLNFQPRPFPHFGFPNRRVLPLGGWQVVEVVFGTVDQGKFVEKRWKIGVDKQHQWDSFVSESVGNPWGI